MASQLLACQQYLIWKALHFDGDLEELEREEAEARLFFWGGLLDLEDVYESDPEELLPLRAGRFPGDRTYA